MPRLGSFIVCEKIIQEQGGKPTLIGLFQKVSAVVPEGQEMPKESIAGIPWAVFTEWFFGEDELGKTFHQALEVVLPDGSLSPIRGRLQLTQPIKDTGSRCFISTNGVPVSQTGILSVRVWLESDSEKVTDVFAYPIHIEHVKKPPTSNGASPVLTFTPASRQ